MTEKRFIIMDNLPKGTHSNIWDKQKQHNQGTGDELWLGEVVGMLNEGVMIAEENEGLKQHIDEVEKDNERLEEITSQFKVGDIVNLKFANEVVDEQRKTIRELKKENEQLKQQVNELIKGIQDSAKMSADAICKPLIRERWGDNE